MLLDETLEVLKDIYGSIKRIVQGYAAVLELGLAKDLEQSQMDRFLINTFGSLFTVYTLPIHKSIMDHIEAVLEARGLDLEDRYDWNHLFSLLHFMLHPPPRNSARSGTVSGEGEQDTGKLLGNKRTLEREAEPEAKKTKNEEPEDADANAPSA